MVSLSTLAGHEVLVLVAHPIAIAGDAPDEVQLLRLAEDRVVVQQRNGHRVAGAHAVDEALGLLVGIDLHGAVPLEEDVDLFLVGVIVGRPGTLAGLKDRIAGDELVGRFAHVEHQKDVLTAEMANAALVARKFVPAGVEGGCTLPAGAGRRSGGWSRGLAEPINASAGNVEHVVAPQRITCVRRARR